MTSEAAIETLRFRLSKAIEYRGVSAKALARTAGLGETVVRDILQGMTKDVKLGTVEKLARALGLSLADLLPSALQATGALEAERETAYGDDTADIVSLDLSLSMGPGTLIEEFVESEPVRMSLWLIQSITRTPSDRLRLVKGIGDSMEPTLRAGDRVLIDISERALSRINGIYWIDFGGSHGIKRLRPAGSGRVVVSSDNPVAGDFEVAADEIRIEGRVIWYGREL
ncbi:helix-turn-helix domain-containing protein [Sphingomonas aliaeris]|uniref:Helix-turn-helix domain-containing protein n=1 Tax=Sphingomonas aliaeris TaxID=2759526 RepID=A0A974S3G2_9SPHN|nr:S24 family peptidase [Sphingomonas aliaeris]QQV76512.1 helix-turn-helix domain-containing protein [Sphingomonas aliaeris]